MKIIFSKMCAPTWSPSKSNLHKVTLIFMLVKETTGRTRLIEDGLYFSVKPVLPSGEDVQQMAFQWAFLCEDPIRATLDMFMRRRHIGHVAADTDCII